jgi:hypothetical protein
VKRALLALLAVTLALAALAYALTSTQWGLRWLAGRAASALPAGSQLGDLQGTLRGPVRIAHARVVVSGFAIDIGRAEIQ